MKVKIDHVTNSSSASFIIFAESMETDIDSFKQSLKILMDRYIDQEARYVYGYDEPEQDWEERKVIIQRQLDHVMDSVQQLTKHTFRFEAFTSMLNSLLQDIPPVFIWLILESMTSGFLDQGIVDMRLKIEDENGGHWNR